jgi:hypothetical protein
MISLLVLEFFTACRGYVSGGGTAFGNSKILKEKLPPLLTLIKA